VLKVFANHSPRQGGSDRGPRCMNGLGLMGDRRHTHGAHLPALQFTRGGGTVAARTTREVAGPRLHHLCPMRKSLCGRCWRLGESGDSDRWPATRVVAPGVVGDRGEGASLPLGGGKSKIPHLGQPSCRRRGSVNLLQLLENPWALEGEGLGPNGTGHRYVQHRSLESGGSGLGCHRRADQVWPTLAQGAIVLVFLPSGIPLEMTQDLIEAAQTHLADWEEWG
jgi:hypothetical protein